MTSGPSILPRACLVLAIVVTGAVTAAAGGCAARGPSGPRPVMAPLLTWLGEFNRPSGATYAQLSDSGRFGSLSGLVHDAATGHWLAVIDDREDTRVAWISIAFKDKRLIVSPVRMQPLRAGPGIPERVAAQSDLEAITALHDGTFMMSEEGHVRDGEVWQPALLRVTPEAVVTAIVEFPGEFQITGDGKTGLRDNQGFESLTITPSGTLIAGLEQPLIQDGLPSFERGAPGRLIEFVPDGATFKAGRQWIYRLSPTPRMAGFERVCGDGENGLVDLIALSDTRLVAMERACLIDDQAERTANPVRLYFVELDGGEARKTLLLDLETIVWRLPPELSRLDNYEALAFGPLVNNRRTLLVVSDDNFRKTQRTSFLLFGMLY